MFSCSSMTGFRLPAPNQGFGPSTRWRRSLTIVSLHALSSGDRVCLSTNAAGVWGRRTSHGLPRNVVRHAHSLGEMAQPGRKVAAMNEKNYPPHDMEGLVGWQALTAIILLLLFSSVAAGRF